MGLLEHARDRLRELQAAIGLPGSRPGAGPARFLAFLYVSGATLGLASMALPQPAGTNYLGIYLIIAAAYVMAGLTLRFGSAHPRATLHTALAVGTLLITLGILATGQDMSVYGLFYIWVVLDAFYSLSRRYALVHVGLVAMAYAIVLALQEPTGAAERWLITVGTVLVAGLLVGFMRGRVDTLVGELRGAVSRLEEIARTDPLTGLLNRRGFDEVLDRELARSHRSGEPCCLMIADLDHFKRVNDRSGHAAGDAALKQTAALITDSVRRGDLVARLGGEEFAVVLPEIDSNGGLVIAERLRRELQAFFAGRAVGLTISIGLASAPQDGSEAPALTVVADRALYLAKSRGRNRSMVGGEAEIRM